MTSDVFIAGLIGMTLIALVIVALSSTSRGDPRDDKDDQRQDK